VNAELRPTGLIVQNNVAPTITSVRGYLVWGAGEDIVILGNTIPNSTREHTIRLAGAERVNVAYNSLTNLNRKSEGDTLDSNKGSLTIQRASYVYASHNDLHNGPAGMGPLGAADGWRHPESRTQYVIFEHNTLHGASIEVSAGSEHITIRDNVVNHEGRRAIYVKAQDETLGADGNPLYAERKIINLTISNNTAINDSVDGSFLQVAGDTNRQITLTSNLFVSPNLEIGHDQNAAVYINDNDLSGFRTISGNIWNLPVANQLVNNAAIYVYSGVSLQGYRSASQWEAYNEVEGDIFENVTLSINSRNATVGSVNAGARLAA